MSHLDEHHDMQTPLTQTGYETRSRATVSADAGPRRRVDPPAWIRHDGAVDGGHPVAQNLKSANLRRFMDELRQAQGLEDTATVLMSEMLSVCDDAIGHSRYRQSGRMSRAVLHLRPEGGYRGLVTIDAKTRTPSAIDDPSFLSSATAWEHVRHLKRALWIDVKYGHAMPLIPEAGAKPRKEAPQFNGRRTLEQMRARETTHLLVLPLLGPADSIHGLISLEAKCKDATGKPFVWLECIEDIQMLVAVGTPWLLGLSVEPSPAPDAHPLLPVVGATMRQIIKPLTVFARQTETLLLLGQTGTGKSRLARWCHSISPRSEKPLVVVDITAIPERLRAGELFGWKKGAFTDANKDRVGAVARAEGGTLFIDEIDKLDRPTQASLLRLLEDHQYEILGDDGGVRKADVRFIVGTNADLGAAIEDGRFMPDLYYRINVLPVCLPPLSERQDEIVPWARYMLDRRIQEGGDETSVVLTTEACDVLRRYPWPGNLRQLDNIVRRAYMHSLVGQPEGERAGEHEVGIEHVEKALSFELRKVKSIRSGDLIGALRRSAAEAVIAARRVRDKNKNKNKCLDVDLLLNSLRALLYQEMMASESSAEDAFALVGRGNLVKARNHTRAMRQANEQLEELKALIEDEESE